MPINGNGGSPAASVVAAPAPPSSQGSARHHNNTSSASLPISAAGYSPSLSAHATPNGNKKGKGNGEGKASAAGAAPTAPSTAAAHILTLGQLDVDRRLDFLATNRVVAVLEKAVERLQLLSLLDAADAAGNSDAAAAAGDDADDADPAGGGGSSAKRGKQTNTDATMSKTQRILARFAVDMHATNAADAAQSNHAVIQEALLASTATSRPAATFVSLEDGQNKDPAQLRRTNAQVTAVLADASQVNRRGRPTVAEMLVEQQRLEARYGELLRAAQQLSRTTSQQQQPLAQSAVDSATSRHPLGATQTVDRALQPYFTQVRDGERAAIQHELRVVSQRLREHNKSLCTQLKDAPNDGDNWRKIANERKELIALLKQTIGELTTGYAESRRTHYHGTGTLEGSFRNNTMGSNSGGLRRIDSKSSLLSGHNGGGGGDFSRRGSAQSDAMDSYAPSGASSQQPALLKRFGSTMQMRRLVKQTTNHPRVPLFSSYAQFARKILQEDAAQRWADDLVRKERELNQNVKQLQSDLLVERSRKEKEVGERNARIHALRVQLRELKRELKQRSDEAKARAEAAGEGQQRRAQEEECELDDRCNELQRELTVEQRTHELFARHLRERTAAMDALAAAWQQKNPGEIKRTELKKMDAEQTRQQCSERLEGCEKELEKQQELQAERERVAAEAAEATQAAEAQRQAVYVAASKLQSAVRAMLTREMIAKQKKKSSRKKRKSTAGA